MSTQLNCRMPLVGLQALEAQLDLFERWGFRPPVALEKAAKAPAGAE